MIGDRCHSCNQRSAGCRVLGAPGLAFETWDWDSECPRNVDRWPIQARSWPEWGGYKDQFSRFATNPVSSRLKRREGTCVRFSANRPLANRTLAIYFYFGLVFSLRLIWLSLLLFRAG